MGAVVVVGGGYAGIAVAHGLDDVADVVLVDPRDAFVNVSSSMRAMVRADWSTRPFFDYSTLLSRGRVERGLVVSVDDAGVELADGRRIAADVVVLATGSSHSFPARPRRVDTDANDAAADLRDAGEQLERADRVLILGAGPVGLELAGEIRDAWPEKTITIIDRAEAPLPGFLPAVRAELLDQLADLDILLMSGTGLVAPPEVEPGVASTFAVTTSAGDEVTADIWFRTFGSSPHVEYLADGSFVRLTERGTVPVDEHLRVLGHERVYALGDIADLSDAKMATWAQTQAPVVISNVAAELRGEPPATVYEPGGAPRILLPLGTRRGVGQLPGEDGVARAASTDEVVQRKGADLFTARFAARFGKG